MKKEVRDIVDALEAQGWRVVRGKKHVKAYPPDKDKRMVTIPGTPGDQRSLKNLKAQLRRNGADI